ncbi:MAG TPA: hypothetical protein VF026_12400 [Ktedonobacteraceae bacterium]
MSFYRKTDMGSLCLACRTHGLTSRENHKGIGEIGIAGTATAIANAVYHATGIRVRDLPITLDRLLR